VTDQIDILEIVIDHPRLDAAIAPVFRDQMNDRFASRPTRLLLDLSAVQFIDSTGLGVLVLLLKQMGAPGKIAVVGLSPAVARLLQITRLDTLFLQFDSAEAARAALA